MVRFLTRKNKAAALALPLAVGVLLGSTSSARAQSTDNDAFCGNPAIYPNAVFIAGSSSLLPVLAGGGGQPGLVGILTQESINISVLFQPVDSCVALNDLLLGQSSGTVPATHPQLTSFQNPIFYGIPQMIPGTNAMTVVGDTCVPSPLPPIDIAVTDVYYDTCNATTQIASMPESIGEILGPIETASFAAPALSGATAISAEAAYVVFGYDAMGYAVPPWTDPGSIFVRQATSGVQMLLGAAIGLQSPQWANSDVATVGATPCLPTEPMNDGCLPLQQEAPAAFMGAALANVIENQSAGIGVLSESEVSQYNGAATDNKLKILAYQHAGQPCGYLPDSTASAKDKLNVRQGRYAAWGPLHFFFNADAAGNPVPGDPSRAGDTGKIAAIASVLNYFVATGPHPQPLLPIQGKLDGLATSLSADAGFGPGSAAPSVGPVEKQAIVSAETASSLVPWCAMQVVRTSEIGPEASYEPSEPCTCFYSVTTGATVPDYCSTCTVDSDCAAPNPKCRLGYCEVQ
jgi:hypothetical protein